MDEEGRGGGGCRVLPPPFQHHPPTETETETGTGTKRR